MRFDSPRLVRLGDLNSEPQRLKPRLSFEIRHD